MGAPFERSVGDSPNVFYDLQARHRFVARIRKKISKDTGERIVNGKASTNKVEVLIMGRKNVGSSFEDFLEEEGILEEVSAVAVKRYIAFQIAEKMSEKNLSKSEMARRMETSRSALDRLLDPDNASVTLQTLQSAVQALGGRLNVEVSFDTKAARVA